LLPVDYPDRDFILQGIADGFHIVDMSKIDLTTNVKVQNYASAVKDHFIESESQIVEEIQNGRYKIVDYQPKIISALGAIPKNSGKVRLIHDCSRPRNHAVNDFAETDKFRYQSIQDAVDLISENDFLVKLDLSQAYRVVKIHPSNHEVTGLQWTFSGHDKPTNMVDTRLPFGAKCSPYIFNKLTQAVRAIMASMGFDRVIAYLDDFLVITSTREEALKATLALIKTLRYLGFQINYNKVEGPAHELSFLGITLDTVNMTLKLPKVKIDQLKSDISKFITKSKVTKVQIQSLVGKLNWATQCIYGGRFYLRRLIDRMTTLGRPWHRSRVTAEMKADAHWWLDCLSAFNGLTPMVEARPITPVSIDACTQAGGAYFHFNWAYQAWAPMGPTINNLHINFKEVLALETAANAFGHMWRNKKVHVHIDNQAARSIINKGSCKNPVVMRSLRRVYWLSVLHNFRIKAFYYRGKQNVLADAVSRLHEKGGEERLYNYMRISNG
jgi:hypothetical protein